MFERVMRRFGRLDLLVNNAGVQTWKPLLDVTEEEWDLVIDTNLKGCFLCTQQAARYMKDHGGGSIVNLGSGCNKLAFPSLVAYTASKGGIEMFTKEAAVELGRYGIRVNCIARDRSSRSAREQEDPDYAGTWSKLTPLGRVGTAADIAPPWSSSPAKGDRSSAGRPSGSTERCSRKRSGRIRSEGRTGAKSIRQELGQRSTLSAMKPRRFSTYLSRHRPHQPGDDHSSHRQHKSKVRSQQKPFGTRDGRPVNLYTLKNSHGVEVDAMNYGGIIVSIRVPDRKGQFADIVLGHETLDGYIPNPPYIGAIVGRYANRIANGTFTLDGKTYTLPKNDGPNTLHGGIDKTFNKVVWEGEPLKGKTGVAFTYLSKDGDDGFPGNVKVKVTYTLTDSQRTRHRL